MMGKARAAMNSLPFVAALSLAAFSSSVFAQTPPRCTPAADKAAVAAVEKTPAIGQVFVSGIPFVPEPGIVRVEVQVFGGNPSYEYLVDVRVDHACDVLGTTIQLENNPWENFR